LTGWPIKRMIVSRRPHPVISSTDLSEMITMAESTVRSWTRPYDWAEVVLGAVAVLSPLWLDTGNAAKWSLIIMGALILLDGVASLARPNMVFGEGAQIILGILLFVAPWVTSYTALNGAAWSSWIIGALAIVAGASALPLATAAHSTTAGSH
jgi:uncharacterized membrane protein HdeD (DUF308 family)